MSLHKNQIPILEYDDTQRAVINHDRDVLTVPERLVFAFLGDTVDTFAEEHRLEILEVFETISRNTKIYRLIHQNTELCLCRAPLGGAAAVQLLDFLIGHGVKKIIAVGSCGVLASLPENAFLIPEKALRDEGASYHYLPAARYAETSSHVRSIIAQVLTDNGLSFTECTTWTTDGFFRETADLVAYRREEGCLTVEMECASMAACAAFRRVEFGQLLYTADSLADAACHAPRGWGKDSLVPALHLCLDIAAKL